jgi:hypothetical protein
MPVRGDLEHKGRREAYGGALRSVLSPDYFQAKRRMGRSIMSNNKTHGEARVFGAAQVAEGLLRIIFGQRYTKAFALHVAIKIAQRRMDRRNEATH